MERRTSFPSLLLLLAFLFQARANPPWTPGADPWRTDPVWEDGLAERAVYDAVRVIYDVPREYTATAYTNRQHMSTETTTKSETVEGVPVFKHHWSERVPTENYDYDFSTATFLEIETMRLFKLTVATQEDCGASFKQVWRKGRNLHWLSNTYFPGEAPDRGQFLNANALHFEDELTVLLRDFSFESEEDQRVILGTSQKSSRSVPFSRRPCTILYDGRSSLELPIGTVEAHRLTVRDNTGSTIGTYWFAADSAAPWLHVLVQFEGPRGTSYKLRSLDRVAYWKR